MSCNWIYSKILAVIKKNEIADTPLRYVLWLYSHMFPNTRCVWLPSKEMCINRTWSFTSFVALWTSFS